MFLESDSNQCIRIQTPAWEVIIRQPNLVNEMMTFRDVCDVIGEAFKRYYPEILCITDPPFENIRSSSSSQSSGSFRGPQSKRSRMQ